MGKTHEVNDSTSTSSEEIKETHSYQNKSLDMRERLETWRAEKRKQQTRKSEDKTRWNPSTRVDSKTPKSFKAAYTPGSMKKFRTPATNKDNLLSPSKTGTYKDSSLPIRNRLELWLHEKGKTPQNERLTKRKILKTPSVTPNQRRKTWSFAHADKRNDDTITPGKTGRHHPNRGILKTRSFTEQKKRTKSCAFLPNNKENRVYNLSRESISNSLVVQEDGLHQSLENCLKMLDKDHHDQDEIVFALDDIQRDHPNALRHALYWICRAKLAENAGDYDRAVCMFEQAIAFCAQPEEKIQVSFNELKTRRQQMQEKENKCHISDTTFRTPRKTPCRELAGLDGEVFSSSVIRFCVMDSTPFKKRARPSSEKRILTPVRRTSRWERCGVYHPKTIEEKNMTVASLDELSDQLRSNLVFKPNSLLPCDLDNELRNCLQDEEF